MSVGALFAQQQLPDQQMFDEAATNCLIGVFRKVWPRWWGKQVELVQSAAGAVEQVKLRFGCIQLQQSGRSCFGGFVVPLSRLCIVQVRQYMPSDINSYSWCGRRTARLEQALYDVVVAANKLRTGHSVTGSYALVRATNKVHRRLRRLLRCIDRSVHFCAQLQHCSMAQGVSVTVVCCRLHLYKAVAGPDHTGLCDSCMHMPLWACSCQCNGTDISSVWCLPVFVI